MAIAEIRLQDGRIVEVRVPDGATQEQVGAFVQQNINQFQQTAQQPSLPIARQTRRGARQDRNAESQRDPFQGLSAQTVANIEARFPLPEGRVRGGGVGARQARRRAAELEQVRLINPALAQLIEETGDIDAFLTGAGRGLATIGRAVGLADPEEEIVTQAVEGLRTQTPSVTAGEVVGESAPFAAVGGPLTGLARTGLQRAAVGGALGAAEGGLITKGRGGSTEDALLAATIAAPLGALGALGGSSARRADPEDLLKPTNKEVVKELSQAAPTIDQLKSASREIYKEIDDLGVTIKPDAVRGLASGIRDQLEDSGLDAINTPKAFRAVKRMEDLVGGEPTLRQIDQIRETAQAAAGDIANKKEAALGTQFINSVDEFLDNLSPGQFTGDAGDLGGKYKQARDLWGRARRSELIEDAFLDAEDQASGVENGLRIAFRKILRNKKQRRFFNDDEIKEMRKVVNGTPSANIAKLVGKLGISEGQATNFLGGSIGAFGGATIFGPAGAVLVPAVGQVSKNLAQRLTKGNANFANAVIRAGKDGKKIVAAYLKNVPKAQRDPDELAQLLMRPKVGLDDVAKTPFAVESVTRAQAFRQAANDAIAQAAPVAAGLAGASAAAAEEE